MEDEDFKTDEPMISIGTLAAKVGLSVSSVRHYENEGLIIPFRTESGRRLYSIEDVARLLGMGEPSLHA